MQQRIQRSYDSTRRSAGPMGIGWTHNFDVSQRGDSDGFAGMAETSPQQASLAIAGFYVAKSLLTVPQAVQSGQAAANTGAERVVIAAIIQRYIMDGLTNNVVQVTQPGQSETFVRNPEGSFSSPLGSTATLSAGNGVYTYRTKDATTLTLDAHGPNGSGAVTQLTNRAGVTANFAYDGSGRLLSVSNTFGRTLTLAYNGTQLASVSDGQRSVSYAYDGAGRLASATDPLGHATTYAYDGASRLTQIFNPSYPTTAYVTNAYDSLGRVQQQTDGDGNVTTLYVAGNRTEINTGRTSTSNGVSTSTYLDVSGRTAYEQDGKGNVTSTARYSSGWVSGRTLPEGNSAAYQYDQAGNVASETQTPKPGSPLQPRTRQFTYEQLLNPLLTPATSFSQVVPTDRVLTSADFAGNVTNYGYDAGGNLASVTQPLVAGGLGTDQRRPVTSLVYDTGRLTRTTNPEGMVTTYDYYAGTDLVSAVTVDAGRLNLVTRYGYDAAGNRNAVANPRGHQTSYAYDAARQLIQVTPPIPFNANTVTYTWALDGLPASVQVNSSDSSIPPAVTRYDNLPSGKLRTLYDPLGNATRYVYDPVARKTTVTDAEGRVSYTLYDENQRATFTSSGGVFVDSRAYSANGLLVLRQQTPYNGNSQINYIRDGFDRLAARGYLNGATEQFTYTPDDDVSSYRSRTGQTVSYAYDALHRKVAKTGNPSIAYRYDYAGRLLSAATPTVAGDPSTGQWLTYYDTAGRPVVAGSPDGRATGHIWDAAGNQTGLCAQNTGQSSWNACFNTTYDVLNRVSQVMSNSVAQPAGLLSTELYDGLGRFNQRVNNNGAYAGMFYNGPSSDMTGVTHVFAGGAQSLYYYAFNKAHQVTAENGNLPLAHPNAAGTVNLGTANTLDQVSGGAPGLAYDGNGNIYGDGTRAYAYDAEGAGRLLSAALPGGGSATYRYDPFGRRYSKTVNGLTTIYLHDLAGNEIAEYDGTTGATLRYNLYSPTTAAPVVTLAADGATVQSYSNVNRLGSVVSLSDAGGARQNPVAYQAYGQSSTGAPPAGAGFGYAGYRYDDETGLYYVRNRHYDPRLGRFLQPDPIRHDGGINIYAYVGNDPLNGTDPSGLYLREMGSNFYELTLRKSASDISQIGGDFVANPVDTLRRFGPTLAFVGGGGGGFGRVATAATTEREAGNLVPIAEAAFRYGTIRTVAGYEVAGTAGSVGNTYNMNIWGLYATTERQGLAALANAFRAEAGAAGASNINIVGAAVINNGIANMSQSVAARLGFTFSKVNESTVMLQGPVP